MMMARLRDLQPRTVGFFAFKPRPEKAGLMRAAAGVFAQCGWRSVAVPVLRPALGREPDAYAAPAALAAKASLLVSLGGDGTLLGAARLAAPLGKPVLGINLGGLGFVTALGPQGLDGRLEALLKGDSRVEERRLVRAVLLRKGRAVATLDALNDLVLARTGAGRLATMEASINGRSLAAFKADGLIFSSPTGSTAYALSVGGPVLDPRSPVLLLTLVAPHTLGHRPLVLRENAVLELHLPEAGLELAADGKNIVRLRAGDVVRLQRSPFHVGLVVEPDHDPWAVLREKLGWQGSAPGLGGRRA
jgi:NAD+ kinase